MRPWRSNPKVGGLTMAGVPEAAAAGVVAGARKFKKTIGADSPAGWNRGSVLAFAMHTEDDNGICALWPAVIERSIRYLWTAVTGPKDVMVTSGTPYGTITYVGQTPSGRARDGTGWSAPRSNRQPGAGQLNAALR